MHRVYSRFARYLILVCFSMVGSWPAPYPNPQVLPPKPEITVLIYNYAGVRDGIVDRAAKAAATVFRRAGLETVWMDCAASLSLAEDSEGEDCRRQLGLKSSLVLRILPRRMAKKTGLHSSHFGFALPTSGNDFGYIANVFYHRVGELARSRGHEETAIILGHLMAHEMGHLLLGLGSHSAMGIMHVPWARDQLDRARFSRLLFTPEQAEQIRRQVSERLAAE